MMQRLLIPTLVFLSLWFIFPASAPAVPVDLVLVLDNSGSMMKNDPAFLTQKAVAEFVDQLSADARVAMVVFDQEVRLVVPLSDLTGDTRNAIHRHMEDIDYRGKFSDSPSAIERAIYELKTGGRPGVEKAIVFMTDGIVDTGDKPRDRDKLQWLKNDLAQDAAQSDITIFGIAFTDRADFQLIQRLALRTEGEYFRAATPEDIKSVFVRVHEALSIRYHHKIEEKTEAPETGKIEAAPPPEPTLESVAAPTPVVRETPPAAQSRSEKETGGVIPWRLVAWGAFFVLGLMIVFLLLAARKGRNRKPPQVVVSPPVEPEEYTPRAILTDLQGVTGKKYHEISRAVTKIGKIGSRGGKQLNHIVIEKSTVSRRHADIAFRDGAFWVADQGSMNGTFLNRHRLDQAHRLKNGDLLEFDTYQFAFEMVEPEIEEEKTMFAAAVFNSASPSPLPNPEKSTPAIARDPKKTLVDPNKDAETLVD